MMRGTQHIKTVKKIRSKTLLKECHFIYKIKQDLVLPSLTSSRPGHPHTWDHLEDGSVMVGRYFTSDPSTLVSPYH